LKNEIEVVKQERNQLQQEFDNIMQTPFFKKELDQDNIKKLSELETKIEQEKAKKKKMVANIIKFDEELADARDELSNLKKDKLFYSGELRKLN